MRAEVMLQTLISLWAIKRPAYITGEPGGGKTSLVKLFAEKVGAEYRHKHMPTMLVEDFGVPDLLTGGEAFGYKLPEWWPTEEDGPVVLCFDDRGQCDQSLQKVIANIIQERELHGHALPPEVMVVSTGNRVEDRAGAQRVLSHLADRETELEWETLLNDWMKWAIDQEVNPSLISFLSFRPGLLHDFDPQRPKNPTPRSWVEGVSNLIDVVPPEAEFDCFKGAVGEGPAAEYVGFREIERKMPNIDNLMLHPETTEVPTDPATLYAIAGAIAHRCTDANFDRAITYYNRMPPEFGVLGVSYATRKDAALASTQAFTTWAVANQDVLF
jgi:hypothetical protein